MKRRTTDLRILQTLTASLLDRSILEKTARVLLKQRPVDLLINFVTTPLGALYLYSTHALKRQLT